MATRSTSLNISYTQPFKGRCYQKSSKILLKINELQRCDKNFFPFLHFLVVLSLTFASLQGITGMAVVIYHLSRVMRDKN